MYLHRIVKGLVFLLIFALGVNALAQESSVQRLIDSPRHHEWVTVEYGDREVQSFVVYPETDEEVPVVLLIHENRGLNDWVRGLADQVAEAGYIAVAPDLLSGMGPDGGKTSDFPDENAARDALYQLEQEQVTADLRAVADYARNISAANGDLVVAGFCWGGSQTFQFATNYQNLEAAFVFYGTAPDDMAALRRINAPVYGFYGGNDARVTSTVEPTAERMEEAGKTYQPETYEGAGHGFMRSGEDAPTDDPNAQARDEAWNRWMQLMDNI